MRSQCWGVDMLSVLWPVTVGLKHYVRHTAEINYGNCKYDTHALQCTITVCLVRLPFETSCWCFSPRKIFIYLFFSFKTDSFFFFDTYRFLAFVYWYLHLLYEPTHYLVIKMLKRWFLLPDCALVDLINVGLNDRLYKNNWTKPFVMWPIIQKLWHLSFAEVAPRKPWLIHKWAHGQNKQY